MKLGRIKNVLATVLTIALLVGCGDSGGDSLQSFLEDTGQLDGPSGPAPVVSYRVVETYPHQTDAFTQGLLYENGQLFESTGLEGESSLREVDLETGDVIRQEDLAPDLFGEGLASRGGVLYQLTLDSGDCLVWNKNTFTIDSTISIPSPAWGITLTNEDNFAFSNGTSTIRFLTPGSLQEVRRITVTDNGAEVDLLNELEFIDGLIYANRFTTDEIVAINPNNGIVIFRIDLSGIIDKQANNLGVNDVLNGIAFDDNLNRLFVTGKRWPFLYEIELVQ